MTVYSQRWTRRQALLAMGALFVGSVAQAQGTDAAWNDVLQRAQREGKVTLYSVAPPDQGQRLVDAFQKQYPGIKVSIVRGAGELIPRIGAERANGVDGADVFLYSDPLWFKQNAEHLLELNSPAAKTFPAKYWAVPGKSPLASFPPMGMLVWNKTKVPGGLKSYADLLNPAYKERIGTREDMTAVLAAFLDWQEQTFGAEYLQKLGTQKPKYYASVVPLTQAVAAGEVWIANTSVPSVAKDLINQGAPIDFVIPSPSFAISWAAGALSSSKRPNAARVFANFLMTDEGQRALNGNGDAGSPLDVQGALRMSDLTVIDISKYTSEKREEWRKKFKQYFGTR
jgi:iron(III) transport system substrate-binding protein